MPGGEVLLIDDPGYFRDFVLHAFTTAGLSLTAADDESSARTLLEAGLSACSRTLTLSEGGLFVRSQAPPVRGTSVWVHFGLSDSSRTIDVESVVVHVVPAAGDPLDAPGFGVRFAGLSAEDGAALAAFVEREALAPG